MGDGMQRDGYNHRSPRYIDWWPFPVGAWPTSRHSSFWHRMVRSSCGIGGNGCSWERGIVLVEFFSEGAPTSLHEKAQIFLFGIYRRPRAWVVPRRLPSQTGGDRRLPHAHRRHHRPGEGPMDRLSPRRAGFRKQGKSHHFSPSYTYILESRKTLLLLHDLYHRVRVYIFSIDIKQWENLVRWKTYIRNLEAVSYARTSLQRHIISNLMCLTAVYWLENWLESLFANVVVVAWIAHDTRDPVFAL